MDTTLKVLAVYYVLAMAVWQFSLIRVFSDLKNMEAWTVIRLFDIGITWILLIFAFGSTKEICFLIFIYTIILLATLFSNSPDSFISIWKNRNTFTFK